MKIIIATNNQGKVREFKAMLTPLGYEPVSLKDAGIVAEVVEDGETFEENAHKKARAIYELCGCPVIADDSGLEVDFLDGEPGVSAALPEFTQQDMQERTQPTRNAAKRFFPSWKA